MKLLAVFNFINDNYNDYLNFKIQISDIQIDSEGDVFLHPSVYLKSYDSDLFDNKFTIE